MELFIAGYLIIAAVLGMGVKEGIIKDDTMKRTALFEQKARTESLERLNKKIEEKGWDKEAKS